MAKRKPDGRATRQPAVAPVAATTTCFTDKSWLLALALLVITLVAYTPVRHAGFIFDDRNILLENRMVKAGDGLYRFWFTTEALDYYPLTSSLCWLEWRLWGSSATGYHVVNVFLHAANAALLWIILRRLKVPGAWLAGLIFAIHPVTVATAAWVSEQKSTLSMLFYLLAILLYLRFDEKGSWRSYGLALGAFLLALLSKTAVVMLPVVLLGCVWWQRRSVRGKDVIRSVPFFALSLILGLVTVWFQYHRAMRGTTVRTDSFLSRLVTAGWVPWFYLSEIFRPFNLTVIYPQWHIDTSRWISYIPGMALVACIALFWWKRDAWGRPLLFGFGYFVATLFPVLGFFDQGFYQYSLVADHWQYYSIVGVIALTVAGGVIVCRQMSQWGRVAGVLASVAVVATLGAATWTRANVYKDETSLWRDNLAKNPTAWMAHNNLGNELSNAGELHQAIEHFERALRMKPDYTEAHNNLGNALLKTGDLPGAIKQYELALRLEPTSAEAHYNLGNALDQAGRIQDAISEYSFALLINPQYAEAHNNLGIALEKVGNVRDALGHYEQALRLNPNYAEAHNNLGAALIQIGRVQEAIAHFEQALRIKPDYADAKNNLARARSTQ